MKLTRRTLGWGALLALALLGLATLPVAWAAPEGRGLLQTVPTRTPTPGPATNTPVPPAPTQPPQQPTSTSQPAATPTAAQVAPTATATRPSTATASPAPSDVSPSSELPAMEPGPSGGASTSEQETTRGTPTVRAATPTARATTPPPTQTQPLVTPTQVSDADSIVPTPMTSATDLAGPFPWLLAGGILLLLVGGAVLLVTRH